MARDYASLVTSQHRGQPRFMATVDLLAGSLGQVFDKTMSLIPAFDVDQAIGAQLDAIGLWVGLSRRQSLPLPDVFFSWDDANKGWNYANWKGPFEASEGVVELDDFNYRTLIKAKISSNYWRGTNEGLEEIGDNSILDLGVQVYALDNFDMSTTVYILGAPSAVLIEMIKRGVVPPKTAGVRVSGYILGSAAGEPFFGLDTPPPSNSAGLDFGRFEP